MTQAILIVLMGFAGLVINKNVFIKIVSLEVMNVGVIMLFVAMSWREGSQPPILESGYPLADPLPQAVIITGIVIGFSILTLSVAIVSMLVEKTKRERVDDFERMMER